MAAYDYEVARLVSAYKDAVARIKAELERLDLAKLSNANARTALSEVARILASLNEEAADEWESQTEEGMLARSAEWAGRTAASASLRLAKGARRVTQAVGVAQDPSSGRKAPRARAARNTYETGATAARRVRRRQALWKRLLLRSRRTRIGIRAIRAACDMWQRSSQITLVK